MPAVTGMQMAKGAFALLNVFLPGRSIPANDSSYALEVLNDMLSEWGQRTTLIPFVSRNRFPLVAGKGGPDNRYTIGFGGDFDIEKPSNQDSITAANLILTNSSPEVRVPLGIYTDDAYDANPIPNMSNSQPTGLYYNPTYQGDLGSIFLWPVPNTAINDLELFLQNGVAQFANLTTTYYVPDAYPQAIKYNLADRLQTAYGRDLSEKAQRLCISSLGVVKRANDHIADMANDITQFGDRRTTFNINTGAGG